MTLQSPALRSIRARLEFTSPVSDIRFQQQKAENAFFGLIGVQSVQSNVPDQSDVNLSRIDFVGAGKNISISQMAIEYEAKFLPTVPSHVLIPRIESDVVAFFNAAVAGFGYDAFYDFGLHVQIAAPSTGETSLVGKFIADKFLKITPRPDVSSSSFSYEFASANIATRVAVGMYEQLIPPVSALEFGATSFFRKHQLSRSSHGLTVQPSFVITNTGEIDGWSKDLLRLLAHFRDFCQKDFQSLTGLSL